MEEDILQANEFYHNPRSHYSVHEAALKDVEFIHKIRDVISFNPTQIKGKIVLEIGSNVGVFSMLAARVGAKHVYAWEPTILATYSREIIKINGYENLISIITDKIEQMQINDVPDIIFTSSFGPCLLWSSVFLDFIKARDIFKKRMPQLLPSIAQLGIAGYAPPNEEVPQNFWSDVYGFNFRPIAEDESKESFIIEVPPERVHTNVSIFARFDLNTVNIETISSPSGSFEITAEQNFILYGFAIFFEVIFKTAYRDIIYSTSPFSPPSHYSQFVCRLPNPIQMKKGEKIAGVIYISTSLSLSQCLKTQISFNFNSQSYDLDFYLK